MNYVSFFIAAALLLLLFTFIKRTLLLLTGGTSPQPLTLTSAYDSPADEIDYTAIRLQDIRLKVPFNFRGHLRHMANRLRELADRLR